eukprot:gnl/MRDRNA2_/MRDRNA2_89489_c0_seq1.p1 gnl/MRDRNA2_/MRDRNA2_89489_c0~~gnl/MRDRNA2_/MRDRNA2_89489_c0_seq1.p1  ORF type:complete len:212 (+),score=43.30 gnl/MRDRNA2_/MRDRNA2_89489_c0_seq1:68-703(+)
MTQNIGRPVPKKLEQEVVQKFMRFDSQYAEEKKKKFPHLVRGLPGPNDPGKGSVIWVGLNPDPCAAKWKAKMGLSTAGASSMPNLHEEQDNGLTSATMKRRRNLAKISSVEHFLEQSTKLIEPTWTSGPRPKPCPRAVENPQEMLYAGVTSEGEGRYGYLKHRKALFPQEKRDLPETCFQEVGWNVYLGEGKFVAKVPRPYPPKPSMIIIS